MYKFKIRYFIINKSGLIQAVGKRTEVLALVDEDTLKVDFKGKTMLPGLIDSHGHIVAIAQTFNDY